MSLPTRASPELVYLSNNKGGANILKMADLIDISTVIQSLKMVSSPDATTRAIADAVVRRRIGRVPSNEDRVSYLNGSLENKFGRDGGAIASLWTRVRNATRRLRAKMSISWNFSDEDVTIQIDESTHHRSSLERALKSQVRSGYLDKILAKPDQGKVLKCSSLDPASNHFLRWGFATRFADWRFIHRARLDCVPLNATKRWQHGGDKRCRKCGYTLETLPHVVNHCQSYSAAWQH